MTHLTPDLMAWAAGGLVICALLVTLGWLLGMNDRDQEAGRAMSDLRQQLAVSQELLRRSRQHCAERTEELHVADARIRHLQECNRQLMLRAALDSSPVITHPVIARRAAGN